MFFAMRATSDLYQYIPSVGTPERDGAVHENPERDDAARAHQISLDNGERARPNSMLVSGPGAEQCGSAINALPNLSPLEECERTGRSGPVTDSCSSRDAGNASSGPARNGTLIYGKAAPQGRLQVAEFWRARRDSNSRPSGS